MLRYGAFLVPGGGLRPGGALPRFVLDRLEAPKPWPARRPSSIPLGAHTSTAPRRKCCSPAELGPDRPDRRTGRGPAGTQAPAFLSAWAARGGLATRREPAHSTHLEFAAQAARKGGS